MTMVYTYSIYLVLSLVLTTFVAQTLHKNGRIFLVDTFKGNERLADSVNHLLVVGFYLINVGFVSLVLKYGDPARTTQESIEYLSWKIGIVALVLGAMHFFNLLILSKTRRRVTDRTERDEYRTRTNRVREVLPAD
jgi:hypothetical protein